LVITDVPIGFEVVQENGMVQLLFPEEMVQEVVLEVRVPDGFAVKLALTVLLLFMEIATERFVPVAFPDQLVKLYP